VTAQAESVDRGFYPEEVLRQLGEAGARVRLGLACELARNLGGVCVQLGEINAASVAAVIQAV